MKTRTASLILLILTSAGILFHICILLKLIPYNIAWGGRLEDDAAMYRMEIFSLVLNLFFAWMVAVQGGFIAGNKQRSRVVLWIFFVLFILNTIGNVFAQTTTEKLFAVLTLANVILLWFVLRKK